MQKTSCAFILTIVMCVIFLLVKWRGMYGALRLRSVTDFTIPKHPPTAGKWLAHRIVLCSLL